MYWDCPLNRCMRRPESEKMRDDFQGCKKTEDLAARKKCFDDIARTEAARAGATKKVKPGQSALYDSILGATVGLAAINFFVKDKPGQGTCLSKDMFTAAAVTSLLGELYNYTLLEQKIKKLNAAYKKKTVSENSYDGQISAFKYLKEEQQTLAKIGRQKATIYRLITGLYAATAVIAIAENTHLLTPPCTAQGTPKKPSRPATPSSSRFSRETPSFFANALGMALPVARATNISVARPSPVAPKGAKKQNKLYKILIGAGAGAIGGDLIKGDPPLTSYIIIGLSGIAGTLAWKLAKSSDEQAKAATSNAQKIQDVIDEFKESTEDLCPHGRDKISDVQCFCYLPSGERNPARDNSLACQTLWQKNNLNYDIDAASYKSGSNNVVGCMTRDRRFDATCQCKKFKDKASGKNACFKAPNALMGLGNFGLNINANQLPALVNKAAQDPASLGALDTGSIYKLAAKNKSTLKRALAQFNKAQRARGAPAVQLNPTAAANFLKKRVNGKFFSTASGGALAGLANLSRGQSAGAGGALKKARQKVQLKKIAYTANKKPNFLIKKPRQQFDFSMRDGGQREHGKAINFMKKEYDYNDHDIVKRPGVSLWRVITNRYTNSGLKRLFDDSRQ